MPSNNQNILVTGATGLVGRHLLAWLLKDGYRVRGFTRSPAKAKDLEKIGCEAIVCDVRDELKATQAVSGINIIIHLAAILRPWRDATYESVNIKGTENLITAAQKEGVTQFIFVSALGVREGDTNPYMAAKRKAEEAVQASGIKYVIFRPSYLYGKGSHFLALLENLARLPVIPVVGPGRQRLQLMWVDDLAACIVASIRNEVCRNTTYEIGGPKALEFNEVLDEVSRAKGSRSRPKFHLPYAVIKPFAGLGSKIIPTLPATPDTLELLLRDNACDVQYVHDTFGVHLVPFAEGLKRVLD